MRFFSAALTPAEFLAFHKLKCEAALAELAEGPERDGILQRIAKIDGAARTAGWLRSSLQPPS
jgi:hypothetical protein